MMYEKKFKNIFLSILTAGLIIGCGGSSSSENNAPSSPSISKTVTVERGAVYEATVTDKNGNVAIQKEGKNEYTFTNTPIFPISVNGGWIDLNGDGVLGSGDKTLEIPMKSYSNLITPTTTYIANVSEKQNGFFNLSDSEKENKLNEEFSKLAESLGGEVSVDDLKKVPSEMKSKNAIVAVNAIYKEILENKNQDGTIGDIDINDLENEYTSIKELVKDILSVDTLSKDIENRVITKIKTENPNLIDILNENSVLMYEHKYNLFNNIWKERKTNQFDTENKFEVSNDKKSIKLTSVKDEENKTRTEIKTNLENNGVNSIQGTFTLVDGGIKSSGKMSVIMNVSLSDAKKEEIKTSLNIDDVFLYAGIKVYNL